jgi:hypothetical protein
VSGITFGRLSLSVGVLAAVGGLAVVVRPSLLGGVSNAQLLVTLVGLLALVQGLSTAGDRLRSDRREAETRPVERRASMPTPGDDIDAAVAALPIRRSRQSDANRAAIRRRLENAAVAVLGGRGLSPEAARSRLEAGTWTRDPRAAAFFRPDREDAVPLGDRVRDSLSPESTFQRRARHATAAIAALHAGEATLPGPDEAVPEEVVP